jgi:uncharacterized protein (DUF3084 family)
LFQGTNINQKSHDIQSLLKLVSQGDEDIKNRATKPQEEVFAEIEQMLQERVVAVKSRLGGQKNPIK